MKSSLVILALLLISQLGKCSIPLLLIVTSNSELNAREEAKSTVEKLLISAFQDLERKN